MQLHSVFAMGEFGYRLPPVALGAEYRCMMVLVMHAILICAYMSLFSDSAEQTDAAGTVGRFGVQLTVTLTTPLVISNVHIPVGECRRGWGLLAK